MACDYKEQISYGLHQLTDSKDTLNPTLCEPYIQGDWVCVTEGHILLIIPKTDEILSSFTEIEGRHPDALAVLDPEKLNGMSFDRNIDISGIEFCNSVIAGFRDNGKCFNVDLLKKVVRWARCFGLWKFDFDFLGNMLVLRAYTDDDRKAYLYCAVMALAEGLTMECALPVQDGHGSGPGNFVMWSFGAPYYEKYLADEAAKEAARNVRNFKCWEVRFVQYATIAVRAESEEEAKEIARQNFDDRMFDSEYEIEDVEETCRDYCCDEFDNYYDENGEQTWRSYAMGKVLPEKRTTTEKK